MASTIDLYEALRRVLGAPCGRLPTEIVGLEQARGRRLAQAVATDGPWPATDRSAMDGFAVAAGHGLPVGARLPVVGQSLAGTPFDGTLRAGCAIRIMTGAVVPQGSDTVVPVEQTSGFEGDHVTLTAPLRAGQNIRRLGSEAVAGQMVIATGARIRAAEVGTLAVLGRTQVEVVARPRVAIVATGDEVVPVSAKPLAHQVRESNSWALAAQVEECGGQALRLGVAPDERDALRAMLERALADADVVLTIGGISKGTHDLVHDTFAALGVQTDFHGIHLKPGKPTYFGARERGGNKTFVFGLPGNPASSFTVFDLLVRPMLLRLQGVVQKPWSATAVLRGEFRENARLQATPAKLTVEGGALVAELLPPSPSGDPFSLVGGSCYALLPAGKKPGELREATVVGYSCGTDDA